MLTIRWAIGFDSGSAARGRSDASVVEWTVELARDGSGPCGARAVLRVPGAGAADQVLAEIGPHGSIDWLVDGDRGVEHIDIPGLLAVSFRRGSRVSESVELLYARTTLVERVATAGSGGDGGSGGGGGGRCDHPEASLTRAPEVSAQRESPLACN